MDLPLFDANKYFNKSNNNFFGLNNNSFLDKISNQNNFNNGIKLFNQSKINFNINNPDSKNILNNNNSINIYNNLNESKNKFNANNINKNIFSTSKIDNISKNNDILKNNSFNIPAFPSFFNDNKEMIKKNVSNNSIINEEKSLNENKINYNLMLNNINKINNYKENLKIPNINFLNEFNSTMNRLLYPGLIPFSIISSLNNNFLASPIFNNNIKCSAINFADNNNKINLNSYNKKEISMKENNNIIKK